MMKVFRLILPLALAWATVSTAQAKDIMESLGFQYYNTFYKPVVRNLGRVPTQCADCPDQNPADRAENQQCRSFYDRVSGDGVVRVHVAWGYFDDSQGKPVKYGWDDMGYNPSSDQAFSYAFMRALTKSCTGDMQACGFQEIAPGTFAKNVRAPDGRTVRFEVLSQDSSLTPYYQTNTVDRAAEQRAKSESTRRFFLNAVKSGEIVFYVGHSRNGGGPDFYPPKVLSNRHVDYGYYKSKTPGFNDLLQAVRERGSAPPLLAMYSCLSEARFGAGLHRLSPNSSYIFSQSNKLSPMTEYYNATVATIDGLMRFQCYQGMVDSIRSVRSDSRVEQHLRNFLSDRHPVDTKARVTIEGT